MQRNENAPASSALPAHIGNFLDCVRLRNDPNAAVDMSQYTTVVLAMAMESLRTGRRVKFNTAQKRIQV